MLRTIPHGLSKLLYRRSKHGYLYVDADSSIDRNTIAPRLLMSYIQQLDATRLSVDEILSVIRNIRYVFCDSIIKTTSWDLRPHTPIQLPLDGLVYDNDENHKPCCFIISKNASFSELRYYIVGFSWSDNTIILISPRVYRRKASELISIKPSLLDSSFTNAFLNTQPDAADIIDHDVPCDSSDPVSDPIQSPPAHTVESAPNQPLLSPRFKIPDFTSKPPPASVLASLACVMAKLYFSCISTAFRRYDKTMDSLIERWESATTRHPTECDVAIRIVAAGACIKHHTSVIYADAAAQLASLSFAKTTDLRTRMAAFEQNGIVFSTSELTRSYQGRIDHYFYQSANDRIARQTDILSARLGMEKYRLDTPLWLSKAISSFSDEWQALAAASGCLLGFESVKLNLYEDSDSDNEAI